MNSFVKWLMSPLSEWHVASMQHKLLVGATGAGVGYYLYRYKQYSTLKLVLIALGSAYGVSVMLNTMKRFSGNGEMAAPGLPQTQPAVQQPLDAPVQQPPMAPPMDAAKTADIPNMDMDMSYDEGLSGEGGGGEGIFG